MARGHATIFIECRRCGHKAQREVTELPLPAGARFRCTLCRNREPSQIKVWHTGGFVVGADRVVPPRQAVKCKFTFRGIQPDLTRRVRSRD